MVISQEENSSAHSDLHSKYCFSERIVVVLDCTEKSLVMNMI